VVEDGCLGRSRRPWVVVHGDPMQKLCEDVVGDSGPLLLHQPQSHMDVAEELPLLGGQEERAAVELADAADIVQKGGCEQEVAAKASVQLSDVPADRRHCNGVLEQPTAVGVMRVGRGGQDTKPSADAGVADEAADESTELRVGDLGSEELEETVQFLYVPARLRDERGRIGLGGFERSHLELESVAEALDPAEDMNRVSFVEALVEEVDIAPDPGVDSPARVDELESQIRAAAAGAQALLAGNREGPFDHPVLCQVRDRHGPILGPGSAASLGRYGAREAVSRAPLLRGNGGPS
jgi:hypothetical protein